MDEEVLDEDPEVAGSIAFFYHKIKYLKSRTPASERIGLTVP
jgi:hypothetical protein